MVMLREGTMLLGFSPEQRGHGDNGRRGGEQNGSDPRRVFPRFGKDRATFMRCFGIAKSFEPGPAFLNKKLSDSSGRASSLARARPNADDILLGFRVARDSPERRNGIDPFHRSHFQEASPSPSEWEHLIIVITGAMELSGQSQSRGNE